jgi:hypothetical protein
MIYSPKLANAVLFYQVIQPTIIFGMIVMIFFAQTFHELEAAN